MKHSSPSSNSFRRKEGCLKWAIVFLGGMLAGCCLTLFAFGTIEPKCYGNTSERSSSMPIISRSPHSFPSVALPIETSTHMERYSEGWKTIHVFYGNPTHIVDSSNIPAPYFAANRWFSQYRQDEIVSRLLHGKENGFFVDLAANDAVRLSNTYALERWKGWDGICLEPNPSYWSGLAYRKCQVVGAVVGRHNMDEVKFKFPPDKGPKGGIVGEQFDNKSSPPKEAHRRYTVTLLDIFQKFHAPKVIDYLSLDVEGAEDLIMSLFPFSEYFFRVLTVERPSQFLSDLLSSKGYLQLKVIKRNTETLWIHKSIRGSIDESALEIDAQNYGYRDKGNTERIAPEVQLDRMAVNDITTKK